MNHDTRLEDALSILHQAEPAEVRAAEADDTDTVTPDEATDTETTSAPAAGEEPAQERVTVRYLGWFPKLRTSLLGTYNADQEYTLGEPTAKKLLALRNPDGTPAFEQV
jgi:hypothetical protein